jgi:hypothetical protein
MPAVAFALIACGTARLDYVAGPRGGPACLARRIARAMADAESVMREIATRVPSLTEASQAG